MITIIMSTDHKAFVDLARQQDFTEDDRYEAKRLGGRDIPTSIRLMDSESIKLWEVYSDGELVAMIALQHDNRFIHVNTNAVRSCFKSYLKWLRQFVSDLVEERSNLSVWTIKTYSNRISILKYLGFKRTNIQYLKVRWILDGTI